MRVKLAALLIFGVFFALWQAACSFGMVSPVLIPSPLEIAAYLFDAGKDGSLLHALWNTACRLFVGYAAGLLLGICMGMLLYSSALARNTLGLLALGLQTLPSVCWAPMALLWFGQTESAMYFVVIMGSVWSIAIASEQAIRSVPRLYIQAARVMGADKKSEWTGVIFPAAFPALLAGAKQGWAFSWRSLMSAEIYVTIIAHMGLGQLLHFGRELHAMDQAMGIMLVIVLVGLAADRAVFLPLERGLRQKRG